MLYCVPSAQADPISNTMEINMSVRLNMRVMTEEVLKVLEELEEQERELEEQEKIAKQLEVRETICSNIKEKVEKSVNMNLIHEEILEDGSVVLTINV